MAFSYEIKNRIKNVGAITVFGTYTNTSGSTGGTIKLPTFRCLNLKIQPFGTAVFANQSVVNVSTFPIESGDIPIITSANEVGSFEATII